MLTLQVVLLCALMRFNAGESVDTSWILSSLGDQGKAIAQLLTSSKSALNLVNMYKQPKSTMSRHAHLHPMMHFHPVWYNSKPDDELTRPWSLISSGWAETSRRRIFNEENDSLTKPSVSGTSKENEQREFPETMYGTQAKRNRNSQNCEERDEATQSPPPVCNRLEEYLCRGMNHPLCVVKYPAAASTRPGSKCRVTVRCNYTRSFFSSQGLCFALRMAFPAPRLYGVDQLNLLYNHTVRLYANNDILLKNYTAYTGGINASVYLSSNITSVVNDGLKIINILTDYACSDMTECSYPT